MSRRTLIIAAITDFVAFLIIAIGLKLSYAPPTASEPFGGTTVTFRLGASRLLYLVSRQGSFTAETIDMSANPVREIKLISFSYSLAMTLVAFSSSGIWWRYFRRKNRRGFAVQPVGGDLPDERPGESG